MPKSHVIRYSCTYLVKPRVSTTNEIPHLVEHVCIANSNVPSNCSTAASLFRHSYLALHTPTPLVVITSQGLIDSGLHALLLALLDLLLAFLSRPSYRLWSHPPIGSLWRSSPSRYFYNLVGMFNAI